MVYRGTVQGGIVVLNNPGALADGTPVDVRPRRQTRGAARPLPKVKAPAKRAKATKPKSSKNLPGFGSWRHRKDIGETAEFVRRLRSGVFERPRRG